MKMRTSTWVIVGILLSVLFLGCREDPEPEVTEFLGGSAYYLNTMIPVAGVMLTIDGNAAITGGDGTYRFTRVRPGTHTLTASRDGFDVFSVSMQVFKGRDNRHDIEMTSHQYVHNVSGTVVTRNQLSGNEPLAPCRVVVLNPDGSQSKLQSQTSLAGYYQIPAVPQGQRVVRFMAENHDTTDIHIQIGAANYALDLVLAKTRPTVATIAISDIHYQGCQTTYEVSDEGSTAVTSQGVCYSTSQNPTINDDHSIDHVGTGDFISKLCGLVPGTTYYLRAFATNSGGTSYGSQLTFNTLPLKVGDEFGGGIVAYILQPGDPGYEPCDIHGIIAAPYDQFDSAAWGCIGTLIGGTHTALGSGPENTLKIVAGCSEAVTAAGICDELVLNGYSDWYLPGKDELHKLFVNRQAIGGFLRDIYWSSSEESSNLAWRQHFADGYPLNYYKDHRHRVRAVRDF